RIRLVHAHVRELVLSKQIERSIAPFRSKPALVAKFHGNRYSDPLLRKALDPARVAACRGKPGRKLSQHARELLRLLQRFEQGQEAPFDLAFDLGGHAL